ncbi:hypothetical protein ABGB16_29680 [Micromonospora sp. B11E3]|uniref:hypothetical protein n=1 Tax=Micromonospora sp. B11E3 TaxID=3153562 RepID=UPI00325E6984
MTDFDDMVAAERRKLDEQAAAESRLQAAGKSRRDAWERTELRAWQESIDRIQELFSAAVRRLKAEGVEPLPVLERRTARSFQEVDRHVVAGHRWEFEGRFALDKRCHAYRAVGAQPLIPAERRPDRNIARRLEKYLRDRGLVPGAYTGQSSAQRFAKLDDRSRLRTGLAADQPVLLCLGDDRHPIEFEPARAVESGRIHCFGKADDGTPLMLPTNDDRQPEPLEAFMARAVARLLARQP